MLHEPMREHLLARERVPASPGASTRQRGGTWQVHTAVHVFPTHSGGKWERMHCSGKTKLTQFFLDFVRNGILNLLCNKI